MITDIELRSLPLPAKRQTISADPISGLKLIVQPSGAKSWAVWYRVDGVQTKLTLGSYPAVSLKEARKRALAAKGAAAGGRDPGAEKKAARLKSKSALEAKDTVAEVVEAFIAEHLAKNCKPSWALQATRLLRREIVPAFGNRRLGEIRDTDVHALLKAIAERAPRSSNLTFAAFRRMCGWAASLEGGKRIASSPCDGVKALAGNNKRTRVLDDDELCLLWRATEKIGYPAEAIFKLAILLGLRREEVSGLEWSEIRLDEATPRLEIPGERTKNAAALSLPLSEAAVEIIRALPRIGDSKFVFTSSTGKSHVSGYSHAKTAIDKILREEADKVIPPWQFHDLRRTLITRLQGLGIRLEVTESILGHVSGASRSAAAGHYHLHHWTDEKRLALAAWAKRLAAIVDGASASTNVIEIAKLRA